MKVHFHRPHRAEALQTGLWGLFLGGLLYPWFIEEFYLFCFLNALSAACNKTYAQRADTEG